MLDYTLLAALYAVVRYGSFERAARELHITPSAMSQRIKLLEERVGAVLVRRGQSCLPTPAGAALCRHTERVQWLEADVRAQLPTLGGGTDEQRPVLRIAVNDDSIATWFIDAITPFCKERGILLDLVVDDQDHTVAKMQDGSVQGIVTTKGEPISGCRAVQLGSMSYVAVCAPDFLERYFNEGVNSDSLRQAPCLSFYNRDAMQSRFIEQITGADLNPPMHWVPNVAGYLRMCQNGLGWGMYPLPMVDADIKAGRLVELVEGRRAGVVLYWQTWRLSVPIFDDLSALLSQRARAYLYTAD
jgi:LysR family transcriptional regulator (chromosome initiation inhibitor)